MVLKIVGCMLEPMPDLGIANFHFSPWSDTGPFTFMFVETRLFYIGTACVAVGNTIVRWTDDDYDKAPCGNPSNSVPNTPCCDPRETLLSCRL